MSKKTKKNILFSFEDDELLELRKILFRKGLSPQEFFSHVMHRCVMHDNEVQTFYEGALKIKEEIMKGGSADRIKLGDVDSLYDAIEQKIKQRERT